MRILGNTERCRRTLNPFRDVYRIIREDLAIVS